MANGIEVRDSSGRVVFDTGSRLYRILSTVTAGAGGSFTASEIGSSTVGVIVQSTDENKRQPVTTVSGNTVSWDFTGAGGGSNDTAATLQILVF